MDNVQPGSTYGIQVKQKHFDIDQNVINFTFRFAPLMLQ